MVYIDSEQTIHKNFHKIDITDLEEGDIIYALNKAPEVKNDLAIVTTDGHFIDESLSNVKIITLLKEISR